MHAEKRIALLVAQTAEPLEGIARGVHAFCQTDRRWIVRWFSGGDPQRLEIERWQPTGVLAYSLSRRKVAALQRPGRVVVSIDGGANPLDVSVDHCAVGRLAAAHLLDRGFRNLACLTNGSAIGLAREQGFLEAVAAAALDPGNMVRHCLADGSAARPLVHWLRRLTKPSGLFAVNDRLGVLAAGNALDLGISIPHQLAVLGAGNREAVCLLCYPTLSSVNISYEQVAFEAASKLAAALDEQRLSSPATLWQPTVVAGRESTSAVAIHDCLVAEAVRHMYQHAQGRIDIRGLAIRLRISRRSLEQRFKTALGRTPLQEIHRIRVELAKQALLETDEPMPRIAEQCGFRNAVQFSLVFSRQTGVPPTHYRRQIPLRRSRCPAPQRWDPAKEALTADLQLSSNPRARF